MDNTVVPITPQVEIVKGKGPRGVSGASEETRLHGADGVALDGALRQTEGLAPGTVPQGTVEAGLEVRPEQVSRDQQYAALVASLEGPVAALADQIREALQHEGPSRHDQQLHGRSGRAGDAGFTSFLFEPSGSMGGPDGAHPLELDLTGGKSGTDDTFAMQAAIERLAQSTAAGGKFIIVLDDDPAGKPSNLRDLLENRPVEVVGIGLGQAPEPVFRPFFTMNPVRHEAPVRDQAFDAFYSADLKHLSGLMGDEHKPVLVEGPVASGKLDLLRAYARQNPDLPSHRFDCSPVLEMSRLVPNPRAHEEGQPAVLVESLLAQALTQPGIVILADLEHASGEVKSDLGKLLRGESLKLADGSEIRRHPDCQVLATVTGPAEPGREPLLQDNLLDSFAVWQRPGLMLQGPAGAGKTAVLEQLARRTGRELVTVNVGPDTPLEDLLGSGGGLMGRMRQGGDVILSFSEPPSADMLSRLNELREDGARLPTGEVVKAHPDFRLFTEVEPPPGRFVGTKGL